MLPVFSRPASYDVVTPGPRRCRDWTHTYPRYAYSVAPLYTHGNPHFFETFLTRYVILLHFFFLSDWPLPCPCDFFSGPCRLIRTLRPRSPPQSGWIYTSTKLSSSGMLLTHPLRIPCTPMCSSTCMNPYFPNPFRIRHVTLLLLILSKGALAPNFSF